MGRNSGGVRGGGGSFSQAQIENALSDYVNGYSSEINGWLRSPSDYTLSPANRANIKVLDSILNAPVTNDVLYRKTEAKSIFGYLSQSDYDKLYMHVVEGAGGGDMRKLIAKATGRTFTEKGFMSTSKSASIAEDLDFAIKPIMLRISPGKKARGMDLDKHSIGEEEVLLKRNTRYKVKSVYGKRGSIYVDVDIV